MTIRMWQLLSVGLAGAVIALAAVLVVVLLVANGVPLVQAHNGTAGQVHACVNTSTGAVRFTNATTSASGTGLDRACAANEVATDWAIAAPSGPSGPPGPAGSNVMGGYQILSLVSGTGPVTSVSDTSPTCPGGKKVLGGGVDHSQPLLATVSSRPISDVAWSMTLRSVDGQPHSTVYTVYAICGFATP